MENNRKLKNMKNISLSLIALFILFSCKAVDEDNTFMNPEKPNLEELFSHFDANKDNKLSLDEVEGPLKKEFKRMDTNKDGYLTKVELIKKPEGNRPPPRLGGGQGSRK